ncbi:MAG: glycosyltransferase family 39 protein [Candidatus Omnitrophota bacterium]
MRESRYILILLAVTLFLFFFQLGDMALTDPDETFYAQTAKEMLNEGEWITPTIFGKPQFEKPVFYYLLIVVSYIIFGVGEFAARFPSAVFGVFGILGVYLLGRLLFTPLCGFLSGLVLATCTQYLILARGCVTDMVLTVFILYCLLLFLMGWTRKRRVYYYIASVMAAFAVLTKGPIGLFIPGLVVFLYILFSRQWRELRQVPVLRCILIFLGISLPWYLVVNHMHGTSFVNEFFGFHNVTRFLVPEHRIGTSPLFYVPVILGGFFPWSVFLLFGAWDIWKRPALIGQTSEVRGCNLFLLVWFLVVFLFFSASSTKLVTYIFPLFPVLAIVTGRFWERFVSEARAEEGASRVSYYIFAALSLMAAVAAIILARHEYAGTPAVLGAALSAAIYLLGVIVSLFFLAKNRKFASFYAIVIAILVGVFPVARFVLPVVEVYESSKVLSDKVKELARPSDLVGGESDHRRGVAFYTDRTDVTDIHPHGALRDFISRPEKVWGIIQRKHYRQVKEDMGDKVSNPVAWSGKYVLITNKGNK